jgi:hypothetical protein
LEFTERYCSAKRKDEVCGVPARPGEERFVGERKETAAGYFAVEKGYRKGK